MRHELAINCRRISDDDPAYVIAEIGGNHGGSPETAADMVRIAAACGAEAVKLQKRENRTLYSPALLNAPYENEHSFGPTYGTHRDALELQAPAYRMCQQAAEHSKVALFATAFDEASADFLMELNVPAIKIASGGLTDLPLLDHVARLQVPIILSTGGGVMTHVHRAVDAITKHHQQLALLHCTAAYPVRNWAELNLRVITTYRRLFPFVIGWSGHDNGIAMSVAAVTLGARIIEKHFTLDRSSKGTDHAFSLEPTGLRKLTRDVKRLHLALGDGHKRYERSELAPIAKMRRRPTADGWIITGEKDAYGGI